MSAGLTQESRRVSTAHRPCSARAADSRHVWAPSGLSTAPRRPKWVLARCTRTTRGAGCSEVTADYFSADKATSVTPYLTTEQVARILHCSTRTVRELTRT